MNNQILTKFIYTQNINWNQRINWLSKGKLSRDQKIKKSKNIYWLFTNN